MAVMHAAALRFDDTREGQIGDILLFPDVVEVNIFGSKTDPLLRGQVAVMPGEAAQDSSQDGPSGRQALLDNICAGLVRLGALPPATIRAMGDHLRAKKPASDAGPEAISTWPADLRALALPFYDMGLMVHTLPYYGPWLWEPLDVHFDLSRTCSTAQLCRWSQSVLALSGVSIGRFGAHSMRRGSAAELKPGDFEDYTLARILRHTSPFSTEPYVLTSVRSAHTAAAMRAATSKSRAAPGGADRSGAAGQALSSGSDP